MQIYVFKPTEDEVVRAQQLCIHVYLGHFPSVYSVLNGTCYVTAFCFPKDLAVFMLKAIFNSYIHTYINRLLITIYTACLSDPLSADCSQLPGKLFSWRSEIKKFSLLSLQRNLRFFMLWLS